VQLAKDGMHMVVTEGTAADAFVDDNLEGVPILSAGKTGTAEYCDNIAQAKDLCKPGNWPAHAWYVGYAPYDDPEIVVVCFVYGGTEGSTVSAPVVRKVIDAYYELKSGNLP
jgi:penicillin-binding protein 2